MPDFRIGGKTTVAVAQVIEDVSKVSAVAVDEDRLVDWRGDELVAAGEHDGEHRRSGEQRGERGLEAGASDIETNVLVDGVLFHLFQFVGELLLLKP